ncbi:MAG: hypothetical protein ACRDHW_17135, partial [Ktedonobacteraceae bacterium]
AVKAIDKLAPGLRKRLKHVVPSLKLYSYSEFSLGAESARNTGGFGGREKILIYELISHIIVSYYDIIIRYNEASVNVPCSKKC